MNRAQLKVHLEDTLAHAIESQRTAITHLMAAIEKTEASRQALHDANKECWIDQLDHENGEG